MTDKLRFKDHTYLEAWPDFNNGQQVFTANSYLHPDGRRHLVFSSGETIEQPREQCINGKSTTRIGYRVWNEGVQFLGMSVNPSLRGAKLGKGLLKYFVENSPNQEGEVFGTGKIHKPLIALCLSDLGFKPECDDFTVEILPRSAYDQEPDIPKVHVINRAEHCSDAPNGCSANIFYRIIDPDVVYRYYPLNGPGMTVAINTVYDNPSDAQ